MRHIIFGYKRHGKDTACEMLRDQFALRFISSSEWACHAFIYEQMRHTHGYTSAQECFDDRGNHRPYWYEAIRRYNDPNRARLGRQLFAEHEIYCGIRDREEFYALKNEGLFDLAIWVDASDRHPPEDASSMTLGPDDADLIVSNNTSLEDLSGRIEALHTLLMRREFAPGDPLDMGHEGITAPYAGAAHPRLRSVG